MCNDPAHVQAKRRRREQRALEVATAPAGAGGDELDLSESESDDGGATDDELDDARTDNELTCADGSATADELLAIGGEDAAVDRFLAVLGPLAGADVGEFACHMPAGDEVRRGAGRTRDDSEAAVRAARAAAEMFDGYAALAAAARRDAEASDADQTCARLRAISLGEEAPLPPGTDVPYVRLQQAPTLVETARVFSLSRGQCEPFFLLADILQREARGERCDQVCPITPFGRPRCAGVGRTARCPPRTDAMPQCPAPTQARVLILGEPGTGKSRVLKALQWWALQIGGVDLLSAVAYTWRAALLLGTPDNPACSTSTFFAIDSFKNDRLQARGKVRYHRINCVAMTIASTCARRIPTLPPLCLPCALARRRRGRPLPSASPAACASCSWTSAALSAQLTRQQCRAGAS